MTARARVEEARARLARQSVEQNQRELARAEGARLEEGGVRAGDLAQLGDWQRGAEVELRARAEREQLAGAALRTELAAEVVARRALGAASTEAKLIDAHHVDWRAERATAQELADEEAAVEQWTAKSRPSRA